jgi:hypothetical protein
VLRRSVAPSQLTIYNLSRPCKEANLVAIMSQDQARYSASFTKSIRKLNVEASKGSGQDICILNVEKGSEQRKGDFLDISNDVQYSEHVTVPVDILV